MIDALEKLRGLRGNGKMYEDVVCEAARLADEIQAEIDSKYLLLPVDAEGEPIKVGDVLKNSSGTTRVVTNVGLGGHCNTFSAWDFMAGSYHLHGGGYWHHVKPRTSVPEGGTAPVSVSDECEPAKKESGSVTDADSRERLERDIRGSLGFTTNDVFGWLDRQAAITRREREQHWLEIIGASVNCNFELTNQIAELKKRIDELNHAEIAPEMHVPVENSPEAPKRVCRTCRFSAETDPERKTLTHTCYRFPSEMLKEPDDWCGEWSA